MKKKEKEEVVAQEEVTQEQPQTEGQVQPEDEGPGKIFDFADVHFYCDKCKNDTKIAEGLRGISFTVGAAERTEVKFECSKCGNVMKMYFLESNEEVKEMRRAQLAEQEEAYKAEQENGTNQEDKEVESGQGSVDSAERPTETDEEGAGSPVSADAVGQDVEA